MDTQLLRSAAASRANDADGVRIIDEQDPVVFHGNLDQGRQRGHVAFHAEYAVGCNEAKAVRNVPIRFELASQIGGVCVFINLPVDDLSAA